MSNSLLARSIGEVSKQESRPDSRRTSAGGGASRGSPYAGGRPEASSGPWKHDLYGTAPKQEGGTPAASRPRGPEGSRTARLIISNLHYEVSERELELLFLQIGPLSSLPKIKFDRSGRSMGIAYVAYESEDHAEKAKAAFDGALAKGENITVNFNYTPERAPPPAPGTLLARLEPDAASARRAPRTYEPAHAPRGGRGGGPGPVRGGRGGSTGGRGGREPRAAKVPKTSDDLDKELEAFMGAPEPSKTEAAAAPDVEMA